MIKRLSFLVAGILVTSNLCASATQTGISLKYGLSSIDNDDGWKLKNNSFGLDLHYDTGGILSPRLDFTYIKIDDKKKWGGVSALYQAALGLQAGTSLSMINVAHELYLFGGIGYEYVQDSTKVFDSQPYVQGGVGATFGINDEVSLLTEFRAIQVIDSNDDKKDEDNEYAFFIGVNIPFGTSPQAPVKVTREAPVPAPVIQPAPVPVPPAPVIQPEPQPITVLDSDNDGVPDNEDLCPDTVLTESTQVSERGCEETVVQDSDGDLVPDGVDQCPNTPENVEVDSRGCAMRMTLDIHFDTDSDRIKPESMEQIKLFARYIRDLPEDTIVTIVGHTDNVGNEKYNKKLSYKRAIAVRKAILAQGGIDWRKIKAAGKGSANPVSNNTTAAGRAANRRIEAVMTHTGDAQ
ncbi:MAG: hypothetical protein DSZ05_07240 [Sulfurospirillum sp.]|nr:MAG: hypothetical protein DSZ05_07240 [Sulfurospirillum sp.]